MCIFLCSVWACISLSYYGFAACINVCLSLAVTGWLSGCQIIDLLHSSTGVLFNYLCCFTLALLKLTIVADRRLIYIMLIWRPFEERWRMAISSNIGVWTFLFLEGSPSVLGGDFYEMFIHLTAFRCFFYIFIHLTAFRCFFIYQGFLLSRYSIFDSLFRISWGLCFPSIL